MLHHRLRVILPAALTGMALIFVLMLAQIAMTSAAEAGSCGAVNQRACKLWERVPSCDGTLVEKKGVCRIRSACGGVNQRACKIWERVPSCNGGLIERKGQCIKKVDTQAALKSKSKFWAGRTGSQQSALAEVYLCMQKGGRADRFASAIQRTEKRQAARLVSECLSRHLKSQLMRGPSGEAAFFKTLTVGVGGNAVVILGGSVEGGLAIDLTGRNGPRIYTGSSFGGGSVQGGLDVIVGLSRDAMAPGVSKGWGVSTGVKALAGAGVGMAFDYGDPLVKDTFAGLAVSGGLGAGGGIFVARSDARIW